MVRYPETGLLKLGPSSYAVLFQAVKIDNTEVNVFNSVLKGSVH